MLYTAAAAPEGGHLLDQDWERLACQEMAEPEQEKALDHVTRCAECARIYRGLDALAQGARAFDPSVPAPRARLIAFPRWPFLGGLAAAAALTAILLRPAAAPQVPLSGDGLRGTLDVQDPAALSPRGHVTGLPAELRWQGIATPSLYRVVILDSDGEQVWSSPDVDGSRLDWPRDLELRSGTYFWQVIALPRGGLPGDRRASALATFEVVTSSRR